MTLCVRTRSFKSNLLGSLYRYSTTPEVIEKNDQILIDDTDDTQAKEAEIMKKRNISRLSAAHFNIMNDRRPYEIPKSLAHLTVKYNRKMYGKYGIDSGVNPSICWPSQQDIQERLEYEAVAFPFTIKEMMNAATQRRKEEREKILKRDIEIEAKVAKLDQWKKELHDKVAKKMADVQKAKERKERIVEEVRRHFGFKLDPRDERFQEMLAKREKEIKKQEKQAKKDAKEKIMIAKLQQKNVEISESGK